MANRKDHECFENMIVDSIGSSAKRKFNDCQKQTVYSKPFSRESKGRKRFAKEAERFQNQPKIQGF
jgi:hypothetical protein